MMLTETLTKYSRLFLRNIDRNDIRVFLESSPLYPNLLSVLQTLQYMGLKAQAGQCDWEYLKNLKSPFLLHLRIKSKETLVISIWDYTHGVLKTLHPKKNKWEINTKENLAHVWDGIVIYTDATPIRNIRAKKNPSIVVSISMFVLILCTTIVKWRMEAIYILPILLGLVISLCIYWQNYISSMRIVDKICHLSSMTDCDAVKNSKYHNLGRFSTSCMVLSYFLSQLVCIGMASVLGIDNAIYTLYFISAIVAVPVTTYSVYSQYRIGKICPLCLMILICVIIQAVLFIYMSSQSANLGLLIIWAVYMICLLCLFTLHSHNESNRQKSLSAKIENLKLKRNKDIFLIESSYAEQVKSTIKLGDKTSKINITTIISPSCKHCRKVVYELFSLTERKIKFRWNIILGKTTERDSEIIKLWIQCYLSGKDKFIHELYLWSVGKIQCISDKSLAGSYNSKVTEITQDNDKQIESLKISGFPQIILNDRLLSSIYSTEDLEFLISDQSNIMTS